MATRRVKIDGGGQRKDEGKLRLDLIPADVQRILAEVLTFGAKKYEARNFERGMLWSKAYGPLLRHLNAWALGERLDRETGLPHMAHVLCNAAFLMTFELRGMDKFDDVEPFARRAVRKRK